MSIHDHGRNDFGGFRLIIAEYQMVDTKAEKDEPNTNELSNAFAQIRNDINTICYKLELDQKVTKASADTPKWIRNFLSDFAKLRKKESKRRRIRAEVYETLRYEIFDMPCFGLVDEVDARKKRGQETERHLIDLELDFEKVQPRTYTCTLDVWPKRTDQSKYTGDTQAFLEWRRLTIQCAQSLRKPDMPLNCEGTVAAVNDLLRPFAPLGKVAKSSLLKSVEDLCQKAARFALRIRQSRSLYRVISIERGTGFDNMDHPDFTPEDSVEDGDDNLAGAKVVYTIFGALQRFHYGQGEPVTLEKALIVFGK